MKRIILLLFVIVTMSLVGQTFIESDNEYIGVGADANGMFSIGVPPDPPESPDVRLLLNSNYRAPSPAGAYVGFYIDSIIYSTNELIEMMYPDSAVSLIDHQTTASTVDLINKWIITEWFIEEDVFAADSLYISQVLQPQESGGSGTVVMRWLIRNDDSEAHEVGLVLAMDTKIGDSDWAKIWAPGIPYSDTTRVLPDPTHGWDMPPFWEAYEYDPPMDTAGLVARGILSTPPNTTPDKIAMADWRDILGQYWDVDLDETEPYEDSGVMLWWYPVTVQPGSLRTVVTTYGLSDSSASIGGIYSLSISYPRHQVVARCELNPNPFNLIVGVTNNADSTVDNMMGVFNASSATHISLATGDSVTKTVTPSTLAPGEVGFVSWRVVTDSLPLTTATDCFTVTAITEHPDTFTTSPPMSIQIEGSDYMGPIAELVEPLNNTITSDSLQPIKIYLYDEDVGVDTNRIFFYFYPTPAETIGVDITDPRLTYVNDTLYFRPDIPLENGNVVRFQLTRAEDLNGCPSDPMELSQFRVDLEGPEITGHFPPDSSIQSDSLLNNFVLAYDVYGELLLESAVYSLTLDDYPTGTSVTGADSSDGVRIAVSTGAGLSDTVYWKPGEWTSGAGRIADGYVAISMTGLSDAPDYGVPNECTNIPYSWFYLMNSHGPRARSHIPYDGDYVSVPDMDVVYYLYDGNSLDMSTAFIEFDGEVMPVTGGSRDSLHTIVVDSVYPDCSVINVEVTACDDSLGTPLDASSMTSWSYTIDTTPPFITDASVGDGDSVGIDVFEMSITFDDICAGIDQDSITVMVDGELVTMYSWPTANQVTFEVTATGDSALIDISICDMIDVGPDNWMDTTFVVYIAMEGPRAHFEYSETGYICSATGPIVWYLYDTDGIDDTTVQVTVEGDTYTLDSPELSYDTGTNLLSYTPSTAWTDGHLVTASLDSAMDPYGYSLSAPVSGTWFVDLDGLSWSETIEETHTSTGGSSYDIDDSLLHIHFEWGDGAVDSVTLIFNSDTLMEGDPGLTITDSLISFSGPDAGVMLDSGMTYELMLIAKSKCAFSIGEWDTHTVSLYSTDIEEQDNKLPENVQLLPNKPDPFNAATAIPFILPEEDNVRLVITDILGHHVVTLVDSRLTGGYHEIVWNGKDASGHDMPSGVYNCRIIVSNEAKSQRITLIR